MIAAARDSQHRKRRRRTLRHRRGATAAACIAAMVIAPLTGCAPEIRRWTPPQSPDTLDDAAFLHYLAEAPTASVDEGVRAVLLLVETEGKPSTPEARMQAALDRGLVVPAWRLKPEHVLTRGVLAHMIRRACGIGTDLASAITAPTGLGDRRYAVRACAEERLLVYGSPDGWIRGGELLDAVSRADAYLEQRGSVRDADP